MKPEIKFKKVLVGGERAYEILSIDGVKEYIDLPTAYLSDGSRFSMHDRALSIVSFAIDGNFVVGDVMTEDMFGELPHAMKKAAARLKEINEHIAANAVGRRSHTRTGGMKMNHLIKCEECGGTDVTEKCDIHTDADGIMSGNVSYVCKSCNHCITFDDVPVKFEGDAAIRWSEETAKKRRGEDESA